MSGWRVLTNSLASNDMLPAHAGYAKTRRRLLENGMELYGYVREPAPSGQAGRSSPGGRRQPCIPKLWPSTARLCLSAALTSTRAPP